MKKTFKNSKGITLVALVITIIILLILAGISISALTNTGIFQKAKDAKQKSENAALDQNTKLDEYENELDKYLPKQLVDKVNDGTIKVGDYISYTPDGASTENILQELATYSGNTDSTKNTTSTLTQEIDKETGLKWRVLDVKDGKVRLISDRPTTSTITLVGAKGYNNAVYLLDKTCKTLYNNSKLASNVQNLKIEDIQDHLAYDYTQYTNSNVDTGKYGGTKEYTPRNYPDIFAKEKTGWVNGIKGTELNLSEQTTPIDEINTTANGKIKITQTYWKKTMSANDFNGDSKEMYYKLFINNGEKNYNAYWMSSRCVRANSDRAPFSVRYVDSGDVYAYALYNSDGDEGSGDYAFRPCITLNSNVQVTSGNGTESTPFEIK